jgi:hypothetical protein
MKTYIIQNSIKNFMNFLTAGYIGIGVINMFTHKIASLGMIYGPTIGVAIMAMAVSYFNKY